ncbi:MAG: hypothetical protein N3A69_00055 [Leptospiraceae bacterium]|nr:hypothetical protein [Leptospiraceae bacterium]
MKVFLFEHNRELLKGISERIKKELQNFTLLKNKFYILTRESITADYLSMQLVKLEVPSLSFEALRLVDFLEEIKNEFKQNHNLKELSSFHARGLLTQIIEEKSDFASFSIKTRFSLAQQLFSEYERQIENDSQSQIQKPYKAILNEFIKRKGNQFTNNEILKKIIEKSDLKSFECLKSNEYTPLILYGISITSHLTWKLLQKINDSFRIEIYLCKPAILNFEEDNNLDKLSEFHILKRPIEKQESKTSSQEPIVYFYDAPEIHREVEFVAKSILGKIAESTENLHLTRIKVIIPNEIIYAIAVKNTFEKFKIPFAFNNDIYAAKQTAYYTALHSMIQLINSNFDRNIAFNLFQNPCFSPLLPSEFEEDVKYRITVNSEEWVNIIQALKLDGFLDKYHRKDSGLIETNDLTWESIWLKAALAIQGEVEGAQFAEETLQEIPNFIKITHSLLQDILFLKENSFTPRDFANFFREFINIYLDYRKGATNQDDSLYEFQEVIYLNLLSILEEISSINDTNVFSSEIYLSYILERLSLIRNPFSKILRSGVIVGVFEDTSDIVFDYLYVLGVDEKRVPERISTKQLFSDQDIIRDLYLQSKTNFYSIFHYAAKEIHISYVNRDSIGDKTIYPASVYNVLKEYFDSKPTSIPLFNYLESSLEQYESLCLDKESIQSTWLKQLEQEFGIENIFPNWDREIKKEKFENAWKDFEFKEKLYSQHFLPQLKVPNFVLGEEIPLNRFLLFLDCPRKYFYTYTFRIEEEDLDTEFKNFQVLNRINLQKSFLKLLFSNPNQNLKNLLEQFKPTFEQSFIKKNLFTEVVWRETDQNLQESIQANGLFTIISSSEISPNVKFKGHEELQNVLPGGELFDKKVSGDLDLVYRKDGIGFFCKFVFSNEISWKHILELYLQEKAFLNVLNQKWKGLEWKPQILQINKTWQIKQHDFAGFWVANESQLDDYLKEKWTEFTKTTEVHFLAEPMKRDTENQYSDSSCRYCRFQKICPGYQVAYESESEYKKNLEILESLKKK